MKHLSPTHQINPKHIGLVSIHVMRLGYEFLNPIKSSCVEKLQPDPTQHMHTPIHHMDVEFADFSTHKKKKNDN